MVNYVAMLLLWKKLVIAPCVSGLAFIGFGCALANKSLNRFHFELKRASGRSKQVHTHVLNEVMLVWGSLRLALIMNCNARFHLARVRRVLLARSAVARSIHARN